MSADERDETPVHQPCKRCGNDLNIVGMWDIDHVSLLCCLCFTEHSASDLKAQRILDGEEE